MGAPCNLEPARNQPTPGNCFCVCGDNLVYIQPKLRESKKPKTTFKPPAQPLDSTSIYKCSYPPFSQDDLASAKAPSAKPEAGAIKSHGSFNGITTFKVSYLKPDCNGGICYPATSYKPYPISKLALQGKMDGITTHKKEFVALPYSKADITEHGSNLKKSGMPMDCLTTTRISYLDPTGYESPSKLQKPQKNLARSEAKFDNTTTYKMSYIPYKLADHEEVPWARSHALKTGTGKMEKMTTYFASFLPPGVGVLPTNGRVCACRCLCNLPGMLPNGYEQPCCKGGAQRGAQQGQQAICPEPSEQLGSELTALAKYNGHGDGQHTTTAEPDLKKMACPCC